MTEACKKNHHYFTGSSYGSAKLHLLPFSCSKFLVTTMAEQGPYLYVFRPSAYT